MKKLVWLKTRTITRDKESSYNNKAAIHQRVIKILNLHESNYRVSKYMKQKLTVPNGKIGKYTIILEYFNIPISVIKNR